MNELRFQLLRGTAFVLAVALAALLQTLMPHARLRGNWRVNLRLWLVNLGVLGTVCGACGSTVAHWAAGAGVGVLNAVSAPAWVAIPVTIMALDLASYLWHRANHGIPFLWRFHGVHHSDATFTASTGVRFHPGELLLSLPVRLVAIGAIGAPIAGVLAFEAVFGLANLFEHGDIDLPRGVERRLGRVGVTPALHRRHHGTRTPDRDRNFGTIFSIWDRALGTYARSDSTVRIQTGLPGLEASLGFTALFALPLHAETAER